jgi:hypothetical protein
MPLAPRTRDELPVEHDQERVAGIALVEEHVTGGAAPRFEYRQDGVTR